MNLMRQGNEEGARVSLMCLQLNSRFWSEEVARFYECSRKEGCFEIINLETQNE